MAGGYQHRPDGVEGLKALVVDLQRQINEMRSASPLMNAVLRGGSGLTVYNQYDGSRQQFVDGAIRLWDSYDLNPDNYGMIVVDPGAGINYLRIFPPFSDGDGSENSITVQGRVEGGPGNVWVYTDGTFLLDAQQRVYIDSGQIDLLTGGKLNIYELTTTGSAANLRLSGTLLQLVSSSRRYKQDIEDAQIDPAAVLQLRGRTWRDRGAVEADPNTTERNVGFIAEELDDIGLGVFVDYDDQGRPDAIQYDRLTVAMVELAKSQQTQIDAQADQIAALTARLDALED